MGETMVQDVLGPPESWTDAISDQAIGMPDLRGATIVDVFENGKKLTLYARGVDGTETVSVFVIEDQDVRRKIATAIHPGVNVVAALQTAI